ncbi:histidine kinase N-terminal domain-containing protein [Niallia taxi]|uniref:histidine kinase N-terminal domain-containing protein n=1 Tax=Niallia taxi TaxID=2499688 RepID=UPI00316AFEEC
MLIKDQQNKLMLFLKEHQSSFIDEWIDISVIESNDPHKEEIKKNAVTMYGLLIKVLEGEYSNTELQEFAYKVGKERLEADINIGDFIYNVNAGRSILIKYCFQANLPAQELESFVNSLNTLFDTFCYHAVKRYTQLKNRELHTKTQYINDNHMDKLAVLGQISSSFVHEFRNPLTAIIGFNKILRDEYPDLKYLDIIQHELNELNFRITQFLHTSKTEIVKKGKENVAIDLLFENLKQLCYASTVDNKINLTIETEKPLFLYTFKDELKQVLLNLIMNSIDALKQMPNGRDLKISSRKSTDEIVFVISNNGPMIEEENTKTIFEPFYTTKELGTGIGLFVCKQIIDKIGGTIYCKSDEDWTSFFIHHPISTWD